MEKINVNAIYKELKAKAPKVKPEEEEEQEYDLAHASLKLALHKAIEDISSHPLDTYEVLGNVRIGEDNYTLTFDDDNSC